MVCAVRAEATHLPRRLRAGRATLMARRGSGLRGAAESIPSRGGGGRGEVLAERTLQTEFRSSHSHTTLEIFLPFAQLRKPHQKSGLNDESAGCGCRLDRGASHSCNWCLQPHRITGWRTCELICVKEFWRLLADLLKWAIQVLQEAAAPICGIKYML